MVYEMGLIPGAEAVVYVHDRNSARTRVQHGQKRCYATEARSVPDARGHGNDRAGRHTAHDARKRALHAGDRDDDVRFGNIARMGKQPVNARHTDVVEPFHLVTEHLRRQRRFLGGVQVARAGGSDHDRAVAVGRRLAADDAHPR